MEKDLNDLVNSLTPKNHQKKTMKHYHLIVALLWALMLCVPMQAEVCLPVSPSLSPPVDKQTEIKANLRQARYMMEHGNYTGAKEKLERVLVLDPDNAEAKRLLAQCKSQIEQLEKAEKDAFLSACNKSTVEALKSFISSYPNSKYRGEAVDRIADLKLWYEVRGENTKTAYQRYLNQSALKFYRSEAEQRIHDIEADEAWEKCKDANSETILDEFIRKYPKSPRLKDAQYRLAVIKGERYYNEGNHSMALSSLSGANEIYQLSGLPAQHLKSLLEEKGFEEIRYSYDEGKVRAYLASLSPNSPYIDQASDRLALILGRELDGSSSDYDMNRALAYAKDNWTRSMVQEYIKNAKASRAKIERRRRAYAHKRWWSENFKIGIEGDIEVYPNTDSQMENELKSYSAGLMFRFGTYEHLFNLVFGAKYRWFEYNNKVGGAICFPLNFRFNVLKITTRSRMYLAAGGEFGINMDKNWPYEQNMISVSPQLGFTIPHLDVAFFWKSYLRGPYQKRFDVNNDSMIGWQMAVYF